MPDNPQTDDARLTPGAWMLVALAVSKAKGAGRPEPKAHDWFTALLERHRPMVEPMCSTAELLGQLQERARKAAEAGPVLGIEEVVTRALGRAKARKHKAASEWDLAAVIVEAAMNSAGSPEAGAAQPQAVRPPRGSLYLRTAATPACPAAEAPIIRQHGA